MQITFTKMHGLGNDFIIINNLDDKSQLSKQQIQRLANRHTGIGFDQLLLVEKARDPKADFLYRIFNADGSEVAQCGNGARCFARYVFTQGLTDKTTIQAETLNGLLTLQLEASDLVTVNMGVPELESSMLPAIMELGVNRYPLKLGEYEVQITPLAIGNPHAVILVENIETAAVNEIGIALNCHPQFPEGVNVGFMQVLDSHNIRLRVYERGAGETLACGSGACAAAVAGQLLGLLDKQVQVHLPLGVLQIHWAGLHQPVWLTGPAEKVFEGKIEL